LKIREKKEGKKSGEKDLHVVVGVIYVCI